MLLLDDVNPSTKSVSTLSQHFTGGCPLHPQNDRRSSWEAVYQLDEQQWLTEAGYSSNAHAPAQDFPSKRVDVEGSQHPGALKFGRG